VIKAGDPNPPHNHSDSTLGTLLPGSTWHPGFLNLNENEQTSLYRGYVVVPLRRAECGGP
jgi:hypothetical protein